jgi:prepilin-type N-terminal cleavage/methylation domain-containing protein/prepilin-type processing-associated H-X9-DG protein
MRKGFTLIELLVVIAIIAILAAILFPVFLRARMAANTTKCCSHGRELGIAMQMYMDDNSGRYPTDASGAMLAPFTHITWRYHWPPAKDDSNDVWGVGGGNQYCYVQLAKYVKNTAIWICPSPESWYAMKYAYGWHNSWFFLAGAQLGPDRYKPYPDSSFLVSVTVPGCGTRVIGRTVTEVLADDLSRWKRSLSPSQKVFACCYALGDMIPIEAYPGGPVVNPNGSFPHDEGTIYVYVDGHARYRETGRAYMPVGYTTHIYDMPHKHTK